MWKVLLLDKIPQEAFNDYIEVLRYNFSRNEILSSIAFAKYDIGTIEMLQERNKVNLERAGALKNNAKDTGIIPIGKY